MKIRVCDRCRQDVEGGGLKKCLPRCIKCYAYLRMGDGVKFCLECLKTNTRENLVANLEWERLTNLIDCHAPQKEE